MLIHDDVLATGGTVDGDLRPGRAARRGGRRRRLRDRAGVPRGPQAARRSTTSTRSSRTEHRGYERRPGRRLQESDVRRPHEPIRVFVPGAGGGPRARCRPSGGIEQLPGAAHPAVYRGRVRLRLRRTASRARLARRARLGAARPPGGRLPEPDDRARSSRLEDELADLAARRIQAGRVAVELLLLPGGAAAADLPVVVLPARAGARRRRGRRRRALPGLRAASRSTSSPPSTSTCRSTTTRRSASSSTSSRRDAERRLEEFRAELHSARVRLAPARARKPSLPGGMTRAGPAADTCGDVCAALYSRNHRAIDLLSCTARVLGGDPAPPARARAAPGGWSAPICCACCSSGWLSGPARRGALPDRPRSPAPYTRTKRKIAGRETLRR